MKVEQFISHTDSLGLLINQKANELFMQLRQFNSASLGENNEFNAYFLHHHLGKRLFFSIQNSAHILYESILLSNKKIEDIIAIDYGAGLGTLFMLGGKLGFKQFDYNDHLPDWHETAKTICANIGSKVQYFIEKDIHEVTAFATAHNYTYDLILSRNVVEHIYDLADFYQAIAKHNSHAVIYSTTTANYHNPAMRLNHYWIHQKNERNFYKQQRIDAIMAHWPEISSTQLASLVELTRGKAQTDFTDAIVQFKAGLAIKKDTTLRTNTCDCNHGVWCEHLITQQEHLALLQNAGFKGSVTAGYWDTHYGLQPANWAAAIFNFLIKLIGPKKGIYLSPFINITTTPK
ncbi:MAG: hypothetical protein RLY16_958 [Bacteroidota bacterium]